MGRAVEQFADLGIVTTDNPRNEDPAKIARQIVAGCSQPQQVEIVNDRRAAIERALSMAQPGDAVVVAGKGHEVTQIVGNRQIQFDDVATIQNWFGQQFERDRKRIRMAA
jgi:UDP-N-acetylmuramoyl-L-alanyl-D-glutamate--2,6-diaminopimelate ligase